MGKTWPIWHPKMHALYGEDLLFIGVRVQDYDSAIQFVENSLIRENISVYEVFGGVDIVVRVYSHKEHRENIRELLRRNVGEIVLEFFVLSSGIYHSWRKKAVPCEDHVVREWRQRRADLLEAGFNWDDLEEEKREELEKTHLVLGASSDPTGEEEIRAFIVIDTDISTPERINEVIDVMLTADSLQSNLVGLYVGTGMGIRGNILVELGVPNVQFESIVKIVRTLHRVLRLAHPRTQTFIAGNITWERIDHCEFKETPDIMLENYEARFPGLRSRSLQEKLAIMDLCKSWEKYVHSTTKSLADAFIEARISDNRDRLKNAIGALGGTLESALKKHFSPKAEKRWGSGWSEKVKEELKEDKPFGMWTLGQTVDAFARWEKLEEGVFPQARSDRLQRFVRLRNAATHPDQRAARPFESYNFEEVCAIVGVTLQILEGILFYTERATTD